MDINFDNLINSILIEDVLTEDFFKKIFSSPTNTWNFIYYVGVTLNRFDLIELHKKDINWYNLNKFTASQ